MSDTVKFEIAGDAVFNFGGAGTLKRLKPLLEKILSELDDTKQKLADQNALLEDANTVLNTMGTTIGSMGSQLSKVYEEVRIIKDKISQSGDAIPSDIVQAINAHGRSIQTMRETLSTAGGQLQGALNKLQEVDDLNDDAPAPQPGQGELGGVPAAPASDTTGNTESAAPAATPTPWEGALGSAGADVDLTGGAFSAGSVVGGDSGAGNDGRNTA
jgi:ABC-type transporter Mla subunit MlaD